MTNDKTDETDLNMYAGDMLHLNRLGVIAFSNFMRGSAATVLDHKRRR